ncbi:MAG: SH3 domain-containing protein [bacterium]|nr:SH3 domain-containing protein [bacterium]
MKRTIILIAMLALVAAACGSGDVGDAGPVTLTPTTTQVSTTIGSTAPSTQPPVTTTEAPPDVEPADQAFVELFFVSDDLTAKSVLRAVDLPEVAGNAIRALIVGPTPAENTEGLWTAIPADTLFLGLNISDGLATIDLSREFEAGGGTTNILSRLAQVVYTLTGFPTIDEVLFHLDGEPVDVFSGEGVILENPVNRDDYATILPIEPGPQPGDPALWDQDDLPATGGVDPGLLSKVALVSHDDVLNVREDPTTASPIIGMLVPGVTVIRSGQVETTGSSLWVLIETPIGEFWVNDWFLTPVVAEDTFAADPRVEQLLDAFAAIIADDGDLRQVTGRRGLYVSHHGDPIRFDPEDLATILTDPTTYHWPSNAVAPEDIDEIPARTFAEAIADSFLSAYADDDTVTTVNEPNAGGNGRISEEAIPFPFRSFNYIGVHDPGDNPEYGGLDWVTWYVSVDYEDGAPVIVGMTIDQWAP